LRNQIQQVQAITDKASSEQSGHGSHGTSPGASLKETSESVDGSHSSHSKMDKVSPAGGGINMEKGMNHRNGMSASAMGNMNPMRNGPSPLMGGMSRMDNMPIGPSMYGAVGMPTFPAMGMAAPYYSSMNGLMGMNSGSMFGTQGSPYGWWGTNPYAPPNPMTNGVNRYDPFGPMNQMARLNDPYAQMYQMTAPSPLSAYSTYPSLYGMQTLGPSNPYANSFGSKLTFPYSYLRGNLPSP
ncbi:MAG: hypothetical protein K2X47_15570, partial [Bdellovibrionales bacterium]|nr:hypothetical protein [Bdellovibrionales bacterium]